MKSVAIVGASQDPKKFGNKAVRAFADMGYEVFPVHPTLEEIEGHKVYRSVKEIPVRLEKVSLYVPPQVGLRLMDEIAEKGADEVWLNPGAESPELVEKGEKLGLNLIQACSIIAGGKRPSDY
jgi:uncharacterized protein